MTTLLEAAIAAVAGYGVALFLYRTMALVINFQLVFKPRADAKTKPFSDEQIKWIIFGTFSVLLVVIFVIGDVIIALSPFLVRGYLWMMTTFGLKATQLLLGLAVIFLGFGAFFFKLNYQISYGVVEVLFAWIAGIITARQLRPGADWSGQMATLIGAVYIVSRGLGNIKEGIKARSEKAKTKALVSA